MSKPVILTGIRANNDLQLGNYFGAILPLIDMAKKSSSDYQINMFIPDLHSFTTPIDHSKLFEQTMHNAKVFVAAGLPIEDESINLYRQSFVSAHSELAVILNSFTGMGEMNRMTQFKDKRSQIAHGTVVTNLVQDDHSAEGVVNQASEDFEAVMNQRVSVGLFDYPVLMAADILLYSAKYVPVGDDQSQHLEFTRDIAERMNNKFGDLFILPEPVKAQHEFFGKDQGLRIMDLVDPTKKMSKSDDSGKGVIFLSDDPEVAYKKVMSATTDNLANIKFDRENQPGISNLLEILALLRNQDITKTTAEFEGQTSYGDFKQVVAEAVRDFLSDFQAKLAYVDVLAIEAKLASSEKAMNEQANATLQKVQKAVGLRPKGN